MAEEPASVPVKLWVLETLVAFQFAIQHMQTSDPAASIRLLRTHLIDKAREFGLPGLAPRDHAAALAELERSLDRIAMLQASIPRRLVD